VYVEEPKQNAGCVGGVLSVKNTKSRRKPPSPSQSQASPNKKLRSGTSVGLVVLLSVKTLKNHDAVGYDSDFIENQVGFIEPGKTV
jgi:hypothetical protein